MTDNTLYEAAQALQTDWELQLPDTISEKAILDQLTKRVTILLERGAETFFQLMYRLDISEKKLKTILNEDDVAAKIATLIYDRQLQKIESRAAFRDKNNNNDPELKW